MCQIPEISNIGQFAVFHIFGKEFVFVAALLYLTKLSKRKRQHIYLHISSRKQISVGACDINVGIFLDIKAVDSLLKIFGLPYFIQIRYRRILYNIISAKSKVNSRSGIGINENIWRIRRT